VLSAPRGGIVPDVSGSEDFERGLRIRREVLGDEFVDANLSGSDAFMMTFQHLVTELAWGRAWSGTALDRKSKALLSLGILAALGRHQELAIYVRGALTSGATVAEIEEVLVHVTIYCGTPAGRQSFQAVHEALLSAGAIPAE
jgi:4-carboxymuconolactone decarboxylase